MEVYGFDTQEEIKSILRQKENANFICRGKKCTNSIILLAQTLYKTVSLKCKRWAYCLYCVSGQSGLEVSRCWTGGEPGSVGLTFHLLVPGLMWVRGLPGKVCREATEVLSVILMMHVCTWK